MKSVADGHGYNERLFSGGLRSKLHFARFNWFVAQIKRYKCLTDSVLELGCFDGKLIDYLPTQPSEYRGFDANWESGLDMARLRWANSPGISFNEVSTPEEMRFGDNEVFGLAVAMETLEHVPPETLDGYLGKIAEHLHGYFLVTVPNEKGVVFLAKWLVKRIFSKDAAHFTLPELANATLGRMERVSRDEHKGFDYESLIRSVQEHFDVIQIGGFPMGFLPRSLCFGIGIVAKSRPNKAASNVGE